MRQAARFRARKRLQRSPASRARVLGFLAIPGLYVPCLAPSALRSSESGRRKDSTEPPALRRPFQRRCFPVRRAALVRATTHPTACIPLAQQRAWWLAGWLACRAELVSCCAERLATPRNKGYASVAVADEVRQSSALQLCRLRLHRLQPLRSSACAACSPSFPAGCGLLSRDLCPRRRSLV